MLLCNCCHLVCQYATAYYESDWTWSSSLVHLQCRFRLSFQRPNSQTLWCQLVPLKWQHALTNCCASKWHSIVTSCIQRSPFASTALVNTPCKEWAALWASAGCVCVVRYHFLPPTVPRDFVESFPENTQLDCSKVTVGDASGDSHAGLPFALFLSNAHVGAGALANLPCQWCFHEWSSSRMLSWSFSPLKPSTQEARSCYFDLR